MLLLSFFVTCEKFFQFLGANLKNLSEFRILLIFGLVNFLYYVLKNLLVDFTEFSNIVRIVIICMLLWLLLNRIVNVIYGLMNRYHLKLILVERYVENCIDFRIKFKNKFQEIFIKWVTTNNKLNNNKKIILLCFNRIFFCFSKFLVDPRMIYKGNQSYHVIKSHQYRLIVNLCKTIITIPAILLIVCWCMLFLQKLKFIEIYLLLLLLSLSFPSCCIMFLRILRQYFMDQVFKEAQKYFFSVTEHFLITGNRRNSAYFHKPLTVNEVTYLEICNIKLENNPVWLKILIHDHVKNIHWLNKLKKKKFKHKPSKLFRREKMKRLQNYYKNCHCAYQICKFIVYEISDYLYKYTLIKVLEVFSLIGVIYYLII